jgi:hypothetical protein
MVRYLFSLQAFGVECGEKFGVFFGRGFFYRVLRGDLVQPLDHVDTLRFVDVRHKRGNPTAASRSEVSENATGPVVEHLRKMVRIGNGQRLGQLCGIASQVASIVLVVRGSPTTGELCDLLLSPILHLVGVGSIHAHQRRSRTGRDRTSFLVGLPLLDGAIREGAHETTEMLRIRRSSSRCGELPPHPGNLCIPLDTNAVR